MLLLAALALLLFVDINAYKPRVEAAASNALRMDVTVEGGLAIGFSPGLHVTLENVRIRNRGTDLAFLKKADVAIQLLPLLNQDVRYHAISTQGARISIERDGNGIYNYQRLDATGKTARILDLPKLSFTDLVVAYADKQSGSSFESHDCNGDLNDMRHPGGAPFLNRLSLSGQFACRDVRGTGSTISDLQFSVAATEGVFEFKPVTMRAYGGNGSATMRMDRSAEVPTLDIAYTLSKFQIEEFFKSQSTGKSVSGVMDFSTALSMRGRTRLALRQSAKGEMSLSGKNLTLKGMDLDAQLLKFESSQNFNLLDVGAFLFAGPVGLAVTKGFEFSSLTQQAGGSTQIPTVVSKWKVEKGVAYATDVALSTNQHRLAVQGGLDFVDDEYQGMIIALIDAKGCVRASQKINGPFSKPIADKSVFLVPVGPLLKLLDKAKTLFLGPDNNCEVFYRGSVAPPK